MLKGALGTDLLIIVVPFSYRWFWLVIVGFNWKDITHFYHLKKDTKSMIYKQWFVTFHLRNSSQMISMYCELGHVLPGLLKL